MDAVNARDAATALPSSMLLQIGKLHVLIRADSLRCPCDRGQSSAASGERYKNERVSEWDSDYKSGGGFRVNETITACYKVKYDPHYERNQS